MKMTRKTRLTGAELNELSDEEFEKSLVNTLSTRVYLQNTKVRIVKAWQKTR